MHASNVKFSRMGEEGYFASSTSYISSSSSLKSQQTTSASAFTVGSPAPTGAPHGSASPAVSTSTGPSASGNETSPESSSGGISESIFAGSIVGTAIAAALMAVALTLLVVWRQRPPARRIQQTKASASSMPPPGWEHYLPQPADDFAVKTPFYTLLEQLQVHVENHYRDERCKGADEGDDAAMLYLQSPYLSEPLPAMMAQRKHKPRALIKHSLAHLLLDPSRFLPSNMAALLNIPEDQSIVGFPQALSRCRVLLAYVKGPLDADAQSGERLTNAIGRDANSFEAAFRPWMSRSAAVGQHQNLMAIMESAAKLHALLFSQPSSYEFDWVARPDLSHPVALPGLVKLSDEHGNRLHNAQVLVPLVVLEHR